MQFLGYPMQFICFESYVQSFWLNSNLPFISVHSVLFKFPSVQFSVSILSLNFPPIFNFPFYLSFTIYPIISFLFFLLSVPLIQSFFSLFFNLSFSIFFSLFFCPINLSRSCCLTRDCLKSLATADTALRYRFERLNREKR